jgi:hypothetical protein
LTDVEIPAVIRYDDAMKLIPVTRQAVCDSGMLLERQPWLVPVAYQWQGNVVSQHWPRAEGRTALKWAIMDYFIAFIMEFTPGEAMAVGALVGLLPLLLLFVRRCARPAADGEEDVADSAAAPPVYDRLLTCVICKGPVKMSAFASHVASHDTEGYVSSPHPPAASNGRPARPTTPTNSPRPPRP